MRKKTRRTLDTEAVVKEVEDSESIHKKIRDAWVDPTILTKSKRRAFAADLFGVSTQEIHKVRTHYKRWEIPEYVVHEPLRYEKLCHIVWLLRWKLQYEVGEICESIGIREEDVTTCLRVYSEYLDRVGVLCPTCGVRTDPRRGVYCCKECGSA